MKMWKRILSLVLALSLCMALALVGILADTDRGDGMLSPVEAAAENVSSIFTETAMAAEFEGGTKYFYEQLTDDAKSFYNAMRQMCAVAITFYAFSYLWEKKWLPYIGWTLLGITFHSSAAVTLLLSVIYIVVLSVNASVKKYLISISFVLMGISVYYYYDLLFLLGGMGVFKEVYMERYGEDGVFEGSKISNSMIAIFLLVYYILYLSCKRNLINRYVSQFHFIIHTFYTFTLFLSLYSVFLYRIGLYFYLISLFLFSVELSSKKMPNTWRWITILVFAFYWVFNYMIKGNSETIPYTSKILGIY